MFSASFHRLFPRVVFMCAVILAIVLATRHGSPYLVYPDSYQTLLAAQNLLSGSGVGGTLGDSGMWYPPHIEWTRPLLPMAALALSGYSWSLDANVQFITSCAYILSVIIVYFIGRKAAGRGTGAAASLLLALSFSLSVWSGFVMTEAFAVMITLLTILAALYASPRRKISYGDGPHLLLGIAFACMMLTRYEYIALLPLFIALVRVSSPHPVKAMATIGAAAAATTPIGLFVIGKLPLSFDVLTQYNPSYPWKFAALFTAAIVLAIAPRTWLHRIMTWRITAMIALIGIIILLWLSRSLSDITQPAIYKFVILDATIVALSVTWLYKYQQRTVRPHPYVWFGIAAISLLISIYATINPQMERYMTHLLPYLIIPAALQAVALWNWTAQRTGLKKAAGIVVIAILLIGQLLLSWRGLHEWDGGAWYRQGYEALAAQRIAEAQIDSTAVLLVATPEPYGYFTKHPIRSIFTGSSRADLGGLEPDQPVAIIDDAAMRHYFPAFASRTQAAGDSLGHITTFTLDEKFRVTDHAIDDTRPIRIIETTVQKINELH